MGTTVSIIKSTLLIIQMNFLPGLPCCPSSRRISCLARYMKRLIAITKWCFSWLNWLRRMSFSYCSRSKPAFYLSWSLLKLMILLHKLEDFVTICIFVFLKAWKNFISVRLARPSRVMPKSVIFIFWSVRGLSIKSWVSKSLLRCDSPSDFWGTVFSSYFIGADDYGGTFFCGDEPEKGSSLLKIELFYWTLFFAGADFGCYGLTLKSIS